MLGETIDGRFEIIELLGRGGMASVYAAKDLENNGTIALKVVKKDRQASDELLSRFLREFLLCSKIDHPNIIKVYHFGEIDTNTFYTTMDIVVGKDLDAHIADYGPLTEENACNIMLSLADALTVLHKAGIVHRDIKPANVMITEREDGSLHPLLMDFGLARDLENTPITETGTTLGTPYYMSPELAFGQRADHRSDLYQLGVLLYEMLTGKRVFEATSLIELFTAITSEEPASVLTHRPTLTLAWDNVLTQCLAKDVACRFSSAKELEEALVALSKPTAHNEPSPKVAAPLPVLSPKAQKRFLFPLAAFLFFTALLVVLFLSSRDVQYDFSKLKVKSGIESLEVTWLSEAPYPTVVQLLSPQQRTFSKGSQRATKVHQITLTDLEEKQEYVFCILFPNGKRSLTKKAETKRFLLEITDLEETANGHKLLTWRTSPQGESASLQATTIDSKKLSYPVFISSFGTARAKLPKVDTSIREITISTTLPSGRHITKKMSNTLVEQIKLFQLQTRAFDGKTRVGELDVTQWKSFATELKRNASRVYVEMDSKGASREHAQKRRDSKKQAVNALEKLLIPFDEELRVYRNACSWIPLALSTRIVPLSKRNQLDKTLENFVVPYVSCSCFKGNLKELPLVARGEYAFTKTPLQGKFRSVTLFNNRSNSLNIGVSVPFKRPAKRFWATKFNLKEVDDIVAAELHFRFASVDNIAFRIAINGNFSILSYGHKIFNRNDYDLHQRIPCDVFQKGANSLSITYEAIMRGQEGNQVRIEELMLRLLPKKV